MNMFVGIDNIQTAGTALFDGAELAPGPMDVRLEAVSASSDIPDPVTPDPPSAPEPASIVILAFGLAVVITARGYYI